MSNVKILTILLPVTLALVAVDMAQAEVRHRQLNARNLLVDVRDDAWQPDGFVNGLEVPATFVEDVTIVLDGKDNEPAWAMAEEVAVSLEHGEIEGALLKALYTETDVFIRVRWPDSSEDRQHRPWLWSAAENKYVEGRQVEDSVILSFEAGCDWNPSILAGYMYDFDGWQWLAARSDPLGQAVDLMGNLQDQHLGDADTVEYSSRFAEDTWNMKFTENTNTDLYADWDENKRVYMLQPVNRKVYLTARPDGAGRNIPVIAERVPAPAGKPDSESLHVVPQFSPVPLHGGAGEVKAKGYWQDGYWTVEFRRSLITPARHLNDTIFQRITQFSVHVFDQTDRVDESSESGRLFLKFLPPETQLVSN